MPAAKKLHKEVACRSPWILIDPGLHADLVAGYRTARLLLFALFALLGHPLRSQASSESSPGTEILLTDSHESRSYARSAARAAAPESRVEEFAKLSSTLTAINLDVPNARRPQLVCLKTYRAHAPPRGQIPDEILAVPFLRVVSPYFLLCNFVLTTETSTSSTSSAFAISLIPLRPCHGLSVFALLPLYQPEIYLAKGDNCHVCC